MTNFQRYETKDGDRWDNIAYRFRGNPYDYLDIIKNNPTYQGLFLLPGGVEISVPVKETAQIRITPPWEL